jgi:adenylate cyclase
VRITAQLIEAISGAHLWADRFDGSFEDIFELQDKVAASVASVIEPTVEVAEIRRSAERPTSDLTAYDLYLRALSHAYTWEKEDIVAALDLLGQAIGHHPRYGSALALAAECHLFLHLNGWTNDPELNRREGVDYAPAGAQGRQ